MPIVQPESSAPFAVIEWAAPRNLPGPPLHIHHLTHEAFYVVEGLAGFPVDDGTVVKSAGSSLMIPPRVVHTYWNHGTEPTRLLITFSRPEFIHYFEDLAEQLAVAGDSIEAWVEARRQLQAKHDIEVSGPARSCVQGVSIDAVRNRFLARWRWRRLRRMLKVEASNRLGILQFKEGRSMTMIRHHQEVHMNRQRMILAIVVILAFLVAVLAFAFGPQVSSVDSAARASRAHVMRMDVLRAPPVELPACLMASPCRGALQPVYVGWNLEHGTWNLV